MLPVLRTKITIDEGVTLSVNLCDKFGPEDLKTIGSWVSDGYVADDTSRSKWKERTQAAMNLAMQVSKAKTFPWPGAANVIFPLVTIASLQFSARSYGNIIQGTNVVRYRVAGNSSAELKTKADSIGRHMSWQVLEEDCDWEDQHDKLFINVSIVGCAFIKSYFDGSKGYPTDELVTADNLVVDYWTKSLESTGRATQIIPVRRNEFHTNFQTGVFRDVSKESWYQGLPGNSTPPVEKDNRQGVTPPSTSDVLTPFITLEQHTLMDLDQDGYYEPYVVTIEKESQAVLRIVSRWNKDSDITRDNNKIVSIKAHSYYTKFGFIPSPDGGFYDMGFGMLLGSLNETVSTAINQMLDAGTMANSNGGFFAKGIKMKAGVMTFAPWQWIPVQTNGDDLRKSMVPLPARNADSVMFQLLGFIVQYCDRISGTQDIMVGENPGQNTPAETSRNMVEQGTQVYTSIFKRMWRSMKEEFKKRHMMNALFLPEKQAYGDGFSIKRSDYATTPDHVVPVANPNVTSKAQRIQKATMVRQAAHSVPGYDIAKAEREWLIAMDVEDIEGVYPGPDKVPPLPNPKMQVEEMRMKTKQMQIDFEKEKFAHELLEQKQLNNAMITKLEAEAIKLVHEAGNENEALKIEAFNAIIQATKSQNDAIDSRLGTIQKIGQADGNQDQPGGASGMAPASNDQGLSGGA